MPPPRRARIAPRSFSASLLNLLLQTATCTNSRPLDGRCCFKSPHDLLCVFLCFASPFLLLALNFTELCPSGDFSAAQPSVPRQKASPESSKAHDELHRTRCCKSLFGDETKVLNRQQCQVSHFRGFESASNFGTVLHLSAPASMARPVPRRTRFQNQALHRILQFHQQLIARLQQLPWRCQIPTQCSDRIRGIGGWHEASSIAPDLSASAVDVESTPALNSFLRSTFFPMWKLGHMRLQWSGKRKVTSAQSSSGLSRHVGTSVVLHAAQWPPRRRSLT